MKTKLIKKQISLLTNLKMTQKLLTFLLLATMSIGICHAQIGLKKKHGKANEQTKSEEIPYTIANRYFVKNTIKNERFDPLKIDDQAKFDEYFGAATVMGADGKPTAIDFSKQYVIAIVEKESNYEMMIKPISLKKEAKNIILSYKKEKGKDLSFTIRYAFLIIVDKKYDGEVLTKAIK